MSFDRILFVLLLLGLIGYYSGIFPDGFTVVLIVLGIAGTIPVGVSAVRALFKKKITVDLLASIALLISLFEGQWVSVVFINLMITSARIFGAYTEDKARRAIKSLLKLRPEIVNVKEGKTIVKRPIGHVHVKDIVVVEAGERIPIDGVILEGDASVDQSSLTGESMPIEKTIGDQALSATLVVSGSLIIETQKVGKDTTFEKIVQLVTLAQSGKGSIQTTADQFSSWYIFVMLVTTVALYMTSKNSTLVLSVLLVTCADDLAVAIPMAFWAAIGYAAKRGIIVKGGNFLEGLTKVEILVLDKTGTITKGNITVSDVVGLGREKPFGVLKKACFAGSVSGHPLSKAIVRYGQKEHVKSASPSNFSETPGRGIVVFDGKEKIVMGTPQLLEDEHMVVSEEVKDKLDMYQARGLTTVLVGAKGICIGFIALSDEIREGVKDTIELLKKEGMPRVVMLTGDNDRVARRVMEETGVTEYHAHLLPEQKVTIIRELLKEKGKLGMVGDGINDAAALSLSDIGIAMGAIGSDAAIEASDIALMKDDFPKIREIINIGKYTVSIARQNFLIWGIVNGIGLGLVFAGVIGPTGAAFYNFITDFFPILNSLRLLRYHFNPKLKMNTD